MVDAQGQNGSNLELCDFPLTESETSGESESPKKNTGENCEEFLAVEKSDHHLLLMGDSFIFFIKESMITNRIKEFPTPPPKQIISAV